MIIFFYFYHPLFYPKIRIGTHSSEDNNVMSVGGVNGDDNSHINVLLILLLWFWDCDAIKDVHSEKIPLSKETKQAPRRGVFCLPLKEQTG